MADWNLNLKESELDKPIYRIISFDRFYIMLQMKNNSLSRPGTWEDPFENLIRNLRITGRFKCDAQLCNCENAFAQCWSFSSENDLLWRVYSNGDGLRIKTTPRKLINSVLKSNCFETIVSNPKKYSDHEIEQINCFIGKVEYKTINEIKKYFEEFSDNRSYIHEIRSLIIKREPFVDEREVRLIVLHFDGYGIPHELISEFFEYDIIINEIFDEIVFDPRISDAKFDAFKDLLRKSGYDNEIKKSDIYRVPDIVKIKQAKDTDNDPLPELN